jgi:hypothetical protein
MRHRRAIVFGPLLICAAARIGGTRAAMARPSAPTPACGDHGGGLTCEETEEPYFKPRSPERTSLLHPGLAGSKLMSLGRVVGPRLPADCRGTARLLARRRNRRLRQHRLSRPWAPVHRRRGALSPRDSGAGQLSRPDAAYPRQSSGLRRAASDYAALLPGRAAEPQRSVIPVRLVGDDCGRPGRQRYPRWLRFRGPHSLTPT